MYVRCAAYVDESYMGIGLMFDAYKDVIVSDAVQSGFSDKK